MPAEFDSGPSDALERILDIAIQIAWGLYYTHQQGLVHQDVKPRNVMMTQDGAAKVTDFGLAAVLASQGTPSYRSREQAAGQRLTPATDIWSWGVSLLDVFLGDVERGDGPAALLSLNHYVAGQDKEDRFPESRPD